MPRKVPEYKLITLDTETVGLFGELKRIAIYDGNRVYYGYNFDDVEPYLITWNNLGFSVHVYIHNLDFDARKIEKVFERGYIDWDHTVVINRQYAKITTRYYTLHDSLKLLPMSLEKLSGKKGFDVEHGKVDLWDRVQETYPGEYKDLGDYFERCDKDDPLYVEYLGYDVISLYEVLQKMMEVSGIPLSEFCSHIMTTASMARYIFKNGYKGHVFKSQNGKTDFDILTQFGSWQSTKTLKNCIGTQLSYKEVEVLERKAYCGGRTEVFETRLEENNGKVTGYHIDDNSLYPFQMYNYAFPVGLPYYNDKDPETWWKKWLDYHDGLGYICADVFIPQQHIPPLPYKCDRLMFPTGYVSSSWTYVELEYAIKHCGVKILNVQYVIWYPKTAYVFRDFIGTFAPMKEQAKKDGNNALATWTKLIMNTSYGYLCMRRDDKTELKNIETYDKKEDKYSERLLNRNDKLGCVELQSVVRSHTVQVGTGAYVTSYGRLHLLDMMLSLRKRGATIFYCDTDSIVTTLLPLAKYLHKTKLGLWDVEGELTKGIFIAPKVYAETYADPEKKPTFKFKGVSRETQKNFDWNFYELLYQLWSTGIKESYFIEKGKQGLYSIRNMQKKGEDLNSKRCTDKTMHINSKQKRIMDFEHNHTDPWNFKTLEECKAFNYDESVIPWKEHHDLIDTCSIGGIL